MAGRKSKFAELRIFELENLTVNGAIEILNGDDQKRRFLLIKELAGKVLARRIKLGGDKENPATIEVRVIHNTNGKNGNYLQAPRFAIPDIQ